MSLLRHSVSKGMGSNMSHIRNNSIWPRILTPGQKEGDFRRFDRAQAAKERNRLIRNGVIRPIHLIRPQLMVKTPEGQWVPEVVRYA